MFTRRRVQAGIGQQQALDRFAAEDVGLNDLIDVSFRDVSVPDGFGIDHEIRAVLALIETARLVSAMPIALADCFAIATAKSHGVTLLTGDPEILDREVPCAVEDLRVS